MKNVLLVSIAFSPNIGGIETHFDDLIRALNKKGWKAYVLTYKPITTSVKAHFYEKKGINEIYRIPWVSGIFYKLINNPIFEFIYLTPGLLLALPVLLLIKGGNINIIHSHGLVAGFVSVLWGKIFNKRVITTTHSIYHFPENGLYKKFAKWIFSSSDAVLTLSKQSKSEIENLGVAKIKIKMFTYWVDLEKFRPITNKQKAKNNIGWKNKFVVLFVGRLVPEKGVNELLESAKKWNKNITLVIAGTGPLEREINKQKSINKNIVYLGKINNSKLPPYYSAADLVIVPSIHEEGFGRVILESLACGTLVIGSNRGAIPEAMDETVGKLIDVTSENIKKAVEYFYKNPDKLFKLSKETRRYAEKRFSEKNVYTIIEAYQKAK